MVDKIEDQLTINNEKGIRRKVGGAFHTVSEFAGKNLFYVPWSHRYYCDRSYSVLRDYLDFFSLIYVLRGEMEFRYEENIITVEAGEVILLDLRKPHYYRSLSDSLEKWEMIFRGNASEAYYDYIVSRWGNTFPVRGRMNVLLESLEQELAKPLPEDHAISAFIHMLLFEIVNVHVQKRSSPVSDALTYIYGHYGEPLRIGEIADRVNLSRSYFTRLFMKETGQSPYSCLLEVRLNAAKDMLTGSTLSVEEISGKCGFVSPSHFIRVFREKTGKTPAAFRNYFKLY